MALQSAKKILIGFYIMTLTACAVSTKEDHNIDNSDNSEKAVYYDAAYDDHNRAPASFAPSSFSEQGKEKLDPVYIKTQADYFFSMGEAQSYAGNHQKAIESFKMVLVYDKDSFQVPLRLAAEYLKVGSVSQAIEQAERSIKQNPKYIDARLLLGGLYTSMKAYDKALAQYNEVLKFDKNNAEAPLYIGAVYAEQKQYDKAVKCFDGLAKNENFPSPHLAYYYIARVRFSQGGAKNTQLAIQNYKKAIQLKQNHVESVIGLGDLYLNSGKTQLAVDLYRHFQKEQGPSIRVAERLAPLYLEQEQYDQSFEQYSILESNSEDSLNIKVKLALILIEQKKYEPAAEKLKDILAEVPESDKIRFYLGAVYEEMKESDKAIEHFRKVPSISEFYTEATVHAVYLLRQSKKTDEALVVAKAAFKARPDTAQFYAVYGSLLDEKGEYKNALDILSQGVDRFPDQVQLRFYLGTVHDRMGHKDSVVENMKKVVEMDPNHVQGLNYLAFTYSEMGTLLDDAEKLVKRALLIDPKDPYIIDTYGWIMFKKGKTDESIRILESAFRALPGEPIIAEHLGDAYVRARLMDRAKSMYLKAIETEADEKKVQVIKSKITSIQKQEVKRDRDVRLPASSN